MKIINPNGENLATKPYGNMFIVEPKKKWENKSEKLVSELNSIGLKIVENYTSSRFLYLQLIKIK